MPKKATKYEPQKPFPGMTDDIRLKHILTAPKTKGRSILLKHLKGEKISKPQALIAKCCDCMCYHIDGRQDCQMPHCPLYPFMPYRREQETASPEKQG